MKGENVLPFPETFKALSDPTRREILNLLKVRPLSAGEICEHFNITGATVSHHFSILKSADLINDKREGKYIYYELNLSVFEEILNWFNGFFDKESTNEK
jgi:DNA-binding transcriptional ArsR family regulator